MDRAPARVSLADAVQSADNPVSILDVENDAIFHWLRGHRIWTHSGEVALILET